MSYAHIRVGVPWYGSRRRPHRTPEGCSWDPNTAVRYAAWHRSGPPGQDGEVRLFVSEDQGKSWKHKKDYKPSDKQATFAAGRDGQHWFAVQVVFKAGNLEPAELDDLVSAMKVYVNSERRILKAQKSYEELQREVEQLRRSVEQLQQKISQLESDRKPK
jgi:hypothetical protein